MPYPIEDDSNHDHRIVFALFHTTQLMKKIDAVIARQGSWPLK